MCLQFPGLLKSPSSLLAQALPTLGSASSADSVNIKTTGVTSGISNTAGKASMWDCVIPNLNAERLARSWVGGGGAV